MDKKEAINKIEKEIEDDKKEDNKEEQVPIAEPL